MIAQTLGEHGEIVNRQFDSKNARKRITIGPEKTVNSFPIKLSDLSDFDALRYPRLV